MKGTAVPKKSETTGPWEPPGAYCWQCPRGVVLYLGSSRTEPVCLSLCDTCAGHLWADFVSMDQSRWGVLSWWGDAESDQL